MSKSRIRLIPALLVIIMVALIGATAYLLYKDTVPPKIVMSPEGGYIGSKTPITIEVTEIVSDLKSVKVVLVQGENRIDYSAKDLPMGTKAWSETVTIGKDQLKQGPFEIAVWAVDSSLAGFGSGNAIVARGNYTLDTIAPKVAVQSTAHNFNQGGCGLVVYSINESPAVTGVRVGEDFFKGYKQATGDYACLFAMPFYTELKDFNPAVTAVDEAGNERIVSIGFHANPKNFPHDNINISDGFLGAKMPQFEEDFPDTKDPVELFLKVNREMRKNNRAQLREIGLDTSPVFLFNGAFLRLPNAATRAKFGDRRSYFHNGKKIDEQTHLGIDLASTTHADIPASNDGKVVMAEDLGIYGNAVIIDHGMGLQTLYSHLSQIDTSVGATVSKGQIIGKTGATGMAGGDHLHYGVLCSGIPVNPVEWWDKNWIKNNITDKL